MKICSKCGAFVGNGSKHSKRKRCTRHVRTMEERRMNLK